jgi:hypothetical protein
MTPFKSEAELVSAVLESGLLRRLHDRPGWLRWEETELKGLAGRPDFLVGYARHDGRRRLRVVTVAFELKLMNWKRALVQAFRYCAFAHYSYVVMDRAHLKPVLRSLGHFKRANIGLISCSLAGDPVVHHRPRFCRPYSEPLRRKLALQVAQRAVL